jgi:hypothetical protein
MRNHLRRWGHVHAVALVAVGFLVAFFAGAFSTNFKTVFGQKLNGTGQSIYTHVADRGVEQGQKRSDVNLPPQVVAQLNAANEQAAKQQTTHPHPLATPEPSMVTSLVRNYSSRNGTHPALLVVHDTESPNAPGDQDLRAIDAWFNNPASRASSNYTTDADGNTLLLVRDTDKAWTQAYFNPWSISDELIGYASQTTWPTLQLQTVARLFAAEAKKWGIPIQPGAVSGCRILRAGIVQHSDLGVCGGGHHDAGPAFPMGKFIGLVKMYADGGNVSPQVAKLRARTGYFAWLAWYLGEAAWSSYGPRARSVRPNVPGRTPAAWWQRERAFVAHRVRTQQTVRARLVAGLRTRTGYWSWLAWYIGAGDWRTLGRRYLPARPDVPHAIPAAWWRVEVAHVTAAR